MEQQFQFEQINEKELSILLNALEMYRNLHSKLWTAEEEAAYQHFQYIWWCILPNADVALHEIEEIKESDLPF